MHKRSVEKYAAGILLIVYAALFFWLLNRHFAPFGVWSAELKAPATKTRLMSGPTPSVRVETDDAQEVWRLKETPVYFEVDNPKKFDQAELEVEFRGDAPIVEAGVVKSQDPWRVEKRVLYHKYLEELQWLRISGSPHPRPLPKGDGDDLILWQRAPRYESVEEFIENPPAVEEVATVDASIAIKALKHESIKTLGDTRYEVSLRGPQDIYFYTAGEDIEVKFLFQDMNRHDGADMVEVTLSHVGRGLAAPHTVGRGLVPRRSGTVVSGRLSSGSSRDGGAQGPALQLIEKFYLPDDGIEWGTSERRPPRDLIVKHEKPESGVYRLIVNTTDDVFIRRIISSTSKIVWKGTLYLGDTVGYREGVQPVTVYSNGQGYALRIPHPESVQEVVFSPIRVGQGLVPGRGGAQGPALRVDEHNKQYSIQMPREVAGDVLAITVPKRDAVLNTDGFFALSPDAFFLPEPISYASDLDLDRLGINYVLARYERTLRGGGGSRKGSAQVAIHDVEQNEPLQFFVGTPHGQRQSMEIEGVKIKLTKPRLTFGKIWRKIETICPVVKLRQAIVSLPCKTG